MMCTNRFKLSTKLLVLIIASLIIISASFGFCESINSLAEPKNYKAGRVTSYDREEGNQDYWWIQPGQARTILDLKGTGSVRHIWMTTPSQKGSSTWFQGSLETTVIRMYWDGEKHPSVDVPPGIFFCAPFDTSRQFISKPIVLAPLAIVSTG